MSRRGRIGQVEVRPTVLRPEDLVKQHATAVIVVRLAEGMEYHPVLTGIIGDYLSVMARSDKDIRPRKDSVVESFIGQRFPIRS